MSRFKFVKGARPNAAKSKRLYNIVQQEGSPNLWHFCFHFTLFYFPCESRFPYIFCKKKSFFLRSNGIYHNYTDRNSIFTATSWPNDIKTKKFPNYRTIPFKPQFPISPTTYRSLDPTAREFFWMSIFNIEIYVLSLWPMRKIYSTRK